MKKIFIADMTLVSAQHDTEKELTFRDKLNIAKRLELAGADAIELGTPSGSKEDEVVFKTIASSLKSSMISVCGGDTHESISRAAECIQKANACIRIELPISTVQMEYTYHYKEAKMLELIKDLCAFASGFSAKVEFVAKDASRAHPEFVQECCVAAAENGAYAVTVCDDCGDYFSDEFAELIKKVKQSCEAKIYVLTSDKLAMAAANSVAAISSGADGIKTSSSSKNIPSIDVIAEIIRARGDKLDIGSNVDITAVHNIMSDVSADFEPNKTSEHISNTSDEITLNENATLADVTSAVESLGYILDEQDYGRVFESCKRLIVKKKFIGTRELEAVVASSAMQVPSTYHIVSYVVNSGNIITATANITLERDGEQLSGVSVGDGPIDAAFHAIEQIIGHKYELDDFRIQAVTEGREALGSALIRLRADGKLYVGNGISTDIVGACVRAYINALNKIIYEAKN